jgi:pimeloyl-ACP methyl ester carboxylesterase
MPQTPTLFLLSGLLCDESVWNEVRAALDGLAEVRPMAFPGYDSISAMAASVLAAAPERFAVAGHSMGGRVALEIVAQAPNRVDKLALLDTGVHGRRPGEAEKRQELVDLAYSEGMAAVAARWLPPMVGPTGLEDRALMDRLTAMVRQQTPDSFAGQIRALLNRPEAEAGLSRISCPTLLLSGRYDSWSPLSQHEDMAKHIPNNRLVAVEDSGHMSTVEQPASVAAALKDWLTTEPAAWGARDGAH